MLKIMIAPNRYVQGSGAIRKIGEQVKSLGLGTNALVVCGRSAMAITKEDVQSSLQNNGITSTFELFTGECSIPEINRLQAVGEKIGANFIIGIGGGKPADTVKAVAHNMKLPVVIVPSIAATDAPCSALSVIYTPEGVFESYLVLPKNPDLVLVDTEIIANAPARLLVSGMGDALATWFEATACNKAFAGNVPGGNSTEAAQVLANLSYRLLIEHGLRAKLAVEQHVATEDVEKIVEANILLSGIGFESAGLAAAHAIHNGLTVLEETHNYYHGEKVVFGTLVQMVLECRNTAELEEVLRFCVDVGLPVTLSQIGVNQVTEEKIRNVAQMSCVAGETIHNMPFEVTADKVYNAILAADAIGRRFLTMATKQGNG